MVLRGIMGVQMVADTPYLPARFHRVGEQSRRGALEKPDDEAEEAVRLGRYDR